MIVFTSSFSLSQVSFVSYIWIGKTYSPNYGKVFFQLSKESRRGTGHFDVLFWGIKSIHFPSKYRKEESYDWRNEWKSVRLLPRTAFWTLILFFSENIFPYFVSRQCREINRSNGSTRNTTVIANTEVIFSQFFPTVISDSQQAVFAI